MRSNPVSLFFKKRYLKLIKKIIYKLKRTLLLKDGKEKKITLLSTKLKPQFRIKPSEPRTGWGRREDDWKGQRGAA